jgi:hypothetical protein
VEKAKRETPSAWATVVGCLTVGPTGRVNKSRLGFEPRIFRSLFRLTSTDGGQPGVHVDCGKYSVSKLQRLAFCPLRVTFMGPRSSSIFVRLSSRRKKIALMMNENPCLRWMPLLLSSVVSLPQRAVGWRFDSTRSPLEAAATEKRLTCVLSRRRSVRFPSCLKARRT